MKSPLPTAPVLSVSIIIATANRAESLDRTLLSLRQIRYPNFEVLVVDGPSHDNTAEIAAKHADYIRYIPCTRANLSAARNIGIAYAKGDIIVFIDDDAIPEPDWLDLLVAPYQDPNIISVGGFIRDQAGIDFQCKYVVADRYGNSKSYETLDGVTLDSNNYFSMTGTNFSTRRKNLVEIGGFDEEYIYFLDETDVNLRMADRGWEAVVVPKAEIHHKFAASHMRTAARVPRTMYPQLRSKAYFCCVHGLKTNSLEAVLEYIAHYVDLVRGWKRGLLNMGADPATVARLISEVERGAADGVRDAFGHSGPLSITDALAAEGAATLYKPFPLPKPAHDRLRICLLSQDYPPVGTGGIGQWTREVAVGLAARGHEVTVIARSETGFPYIDFIEGVWVHRIVVKAASTELRAKFSPIPHTLIDYSAALHDEIERVQERRRFQIISGPIFDFESLVALHESAIPTIVSLHTTYKLGLPFKSDWLQNPSYLRNHVQPAIAGEGELLVSAPHILANSHGIVRDIEGGYDLTIDEDRLRMVPHGFSDLTAGVVPLPRDEGEVRVLFVGRLEPRKGVDLLLKAIPALLMRYPHLRFDLVGDPDQVIEGKTYKDRFIAEHANNRDVLARTTFHGQASRENLLRHYATCDIFVAPSRYESFGLIFIEAMMFGKPSIGVAVGGVSEVITDGIEGILIPEPDEKLLSNSIERLVQEHETRTIFGSNARRSFEEKFHVDKMLDSLEVYYSSILK